MGARKPPNRDDSSDTDPDDYNAMEQIVRRVMTAITPLDNDDDDSLRRVGGGQSTSNRTSGHTSGIRHLRQPMRQRPPQLAGDDFDDDDAERKPDARPSRNSRNTPNEAYGRDDKVRPQIPQDKPKRSRNIECSNKRARTDSSPSGSDLIRFQRGQASALPTFITPNIAALIKAEKKAEDTKMETAAKQTWQSGHSGLVVKNKNGYPGKTPRRWAAPNAGLQQSKLDWHQNADQKQREHDNAAKVKADTAAIAEKQAGEKVKPKGKGVPLELEEVPDEYPVKKLYKSAADWKTRKPEKYRYAQEHLWWKSQQELLLEETGMQTGAAEQAAPAVKRTTAALAENKTAAKPESTSSAKPERKPATKASTAALVPAVKKLDAPKLKQTSTTDVGQWRDWADFAKMAARSYANKLQELDDMRADKAAKKMADQEADEKVAADQAAEESEAESEVDSVSSADDEEDMILWM